MLCLGKVINKEANKPVALAYYSYHISNIALLLPDLQGNGYSLCDPEIATSAPVKAPLCSVLGTV